MNKNDYRTTVIADDRERKSEIIQFLSEIENVSVGIQRLSVGDYLLIIAWFLREKR
jgi:ERCC4-type nuclease